MEDFTRNWYPPYDGLVEGTCVDVFIKPSTDYLVEVHASELNVYWSLSERKRVYRAGAYRLIWVNVASGGCYETAGVSCPRNYLDGNHGDAFIAVVNKQSHHYLGYSNVTIGHY